MENIISTIDNVAKNIRSLSPAIAGLVIVVIGIMYMLSKDPQQKQQYTGWMVNLAIGFVLVYAGASLVTWFSTQVVGFGS